MSFWVGSKSSCTTCLTNVHYFIYHQVIYLILNQKFGNLNRIKPPLSYSNIVHDAIPLIHNLSMAKWCTITVLVSFALECKTNLSLILSLSNSSLHFKVIINGVTYSRTNGESIGSSDLLSRFTLSTPCSICQLARVRTMLSLSVHARAHQDLNVEV